MLNTGDPSEPARYFPLWKLRTGGVIKPGERLPWGQTIVFGLQHSVVMAGAIIVPLVMGFDPSLALICSGLGTLIFFLVVAGRVPSYLGSSGSFSAVVITVTGYSGHGPNQHLDVALGGIIGAGLLYAFIALLVMRLGSRWIEHLMPPVVTGSIVLAIGINFAPFAARSISGGILDASVGLFIVLLIAVIVVAAPGMWRRLPVLIGAIAGYLVYLFLANGLGLGRPIDLSALSTAPWIGLPKVTAPSFRADALFLIAPVAIVLVAENLGHIKAIGLITGSNLDPFIGRAFLGDSVATILSGLCGGTPVTTYAENIGIMAATNVYSTLIFAITAIVSLLLGASPKFGALLQSIPGAVLGGLSLVLFGLVAVTGARIWVENKVDFANPRNLLTAAFALMAGAGNLTLKFGPVTLGGVSMAAFGAIALYQILTYPSRKE
jgi:uracil-xanthine permease